MRSIILILFLLIAGCSYAQVDTIVWQNKAPLPSPPRIDYASFIIDRDYYVVGGLDSDLNTYSEVWKYNTISNNWQKMKDFPGGPVSEPTGFAINGNGYVCCGIDSVTGYNDDNEFWEYYPAVDSWQHKANYPGVGREAPVSFVYNNYAFVGMGFGVGVVDLWRYNSITDSWNSVSNMPTGSRSECGTSVIDSFAYIFGGFTGSTGYNDVWRYNINLDHWDSIGIMPGFVRANGLFWTFDSIVIGGCGVEQDSEGNGFMASDVYLYEVNQNKWDTLTCLNFPDSIADGATAGCFVMGKTGYFFGGYKTYIDATYYNNMWSFDASQFFPPDTTTGIVTVKNDPAFAVYPNPVHRDDGITVSTGESGSILFYDALGRRLEEHTLLRGSNQFTIATDNEVVFYKATLESGVVRNGKVVVLR